MPGIGRNLRALRAVAILLLTVNVLVGPAGLGGWFAFGPSTCGVSCPCDVADHHDQAEAFAKFGAFAGDTGSAVGHTDHEEPCKDCPDNCPHCGCCVGAALAVLPTGLSLSPPISASEHVCTPPHCWASCDRSRVFRPPRCLT